MKSLMKLTLVICAAVSAISAQIPTTNNNIKLADDEFLIGRRNFTYAKPEKRKLKLVLVDLSMPTVDFTNYINKNFMKIRDQGDRNTCSVHALTFLMEFEYSKQNLGLVTSNLSEEFLNAATNLAAGNKNDGDFFFNINKGYQKYGDINESFLPYKSTFYPNLKIEKNIEMGNNLERLKANVIKENVNFTADASDDENPFGLTDTQMNSVISELDNNHPVAVGMRWYCKGCLTTETVLGVELLKNIDVSKLTAGHSVALVGYRKQKNFPGGGYFIFRNSWGEDFGNQGYGYVSFEYVKSHTADAMSYH